MHIDAERTATQTKERIYQGDSNLGNPPLAWIYEPVDMLRFDNRGFDELFYIRIAAEHAVERDNVCRWQCACQVHEISVVVR